MNTSEMPVSSARKQEVQRRIADEIKKQKGEFARRVESNTQYARLVTEKILKEHKKDQEQLKQRLASETEFYVPAESNFIVAIQIKSQIQIAPRPKKTLELLRLARINNCVILKNNLSIKNMLQNAKDYIAFGTVTYEVLRKLIYGRGYGKIDGKKVKLTNENIETATNGRFKCIEELCDVIYNGKSEMKEVLQFLCPFNLCPPRGGFHSGHKKRNFVQGGATNDHKDLLGLLLERMI